MEITEIVYYKRMLSRGLEFLNEAIREQKQDPSTNVEELLNKASEQFYYAYNAIEAEWKYGKGIPDDYVI